MDKGMLIFHPDVLEKNILGDDFLNFQCWIRIINAAKVIIIEIISNFIWKWRNVNTVEQCSLHITIWDLKYITKLN